MKVQFHRKRKRAGFSLAELLVVVGIIGILLGVAIPSIIRYQRVLKLTELDDNARAVFVAAQNHLTALRSASAGELEVSPDMGRGAKDAPAAVNTEAGTALMYVSTDVTDARPGWLVLPGSIESDIAQGHYLVEFEPKSGSVYGVFFTENNTLDESAYQTIYEYRDGTNSCRIRDGRKAFSGAAGGFYVGYYGADGALDVDRPDTQTLPQPQLKLTNAEELVLELGTDASSWPASIDQSKIYASVVVSDGSVAKTLVNKGAIRSGAGGTVVLDTLKTSGYDQNENQNTAGWKVGDTFARWMADGGSYTITPGADITVTVSIWYQPGAGEGVVALPQSASVTTNSLFAARSGNNVQVAYGRHLQNLHPDVSHLDSTVTDARQTRGINFAQAGGGRYSWEDTYGHNARPFVPIENADLKTYNGGGLAIRDLNAVKASGRYENAGLFGVFSGSLLENVTLVDARATGSVAAGALAGKATNTTVDSCQVYLSTPTSNSLRIQGGNSAGGLIGTAENSTVQNGTFASTVVSGGVATGGLIGRGTNNTKLQSSYAAGHLSGATVGGLVGSGYVVVRNCYAAGTIASATTAAGGLCGTDANVYASYAAVDYVSVPAGDKVYGTVPGGSCTNVYYLVKSGVNDAVTVDNVTAVPSGEQMKKAQGLDLGTAFIEGDDKDVMTVPYNLDIGGSSRDPKLSAPYPYPTLKVEELELPHYGDWLEVETSAVTSLIAYYEQFLSNSGYVTEYSAHINGEEKGAIKSATRTGAINADGYAFLSVEKLAEDWERKTNLTVKTVGMETLESTVSARFLGALDEELQPTAEETAAYYAYAIPTTALDVVPSSACYNEVTVKGTGPQIQWNIPPKEAETTAWVTTFFGRAAYNGAKPTSVPKPIHIRSLRHLANVGRFFGARDYVQDLDVDASIYYGDLIVDGRGSDLAWASIAMNDAGHVTVAGFEVWGRSWDGTSWGYADNQWNMPTEYRLLFTPMGMHGDPGAGTYDTLTSFNGVYDGNGRIIRALSIRSYYYAEDKADYTGLFYRVISGTLKNVHMSDCDVIGTAGGASNATGVLLGRLSSAGQVRNCTVKNCTVTVQGTKAGGHIGGMIGYADNGSLTVSGCTVENCTVEGGAYSHNAGGFVGNIYKLTPDKNTGIGGVLQNCVVKNVRTSVDFTGKDNVTNPSKLGAAGGFVGCFYESTGLLKDCTVIGTGSFGVSGTARSTGGFVGIASNDSGVSIQNCGVRLEGTAQRDYLTQSVSGGQSSGGFVGTMSSGSIATSYSAVRVEGATAGGFAGTFAKGSISNCYAAGHTQNGQYKVNRLSVTGTTRAGGLVGLWEGGSLDTCYTTCAVSGPNEVATDVFANQGDATTASPIPNCYAVGEAFVGGSKRGSLTKTNAATSMPKLNESQRTETHPYDAALTMKYPFAPTKYADGAAMPHYGDWPEEISVSSGGRKWVQQVQDYTPIEKDYDNLTVDKPDWNGDTLTITYHVDSLAYENDLTNTGPKAPDGTPYFNGVFCLTSDLGYRQIFRIVNGEGGYEILGLPGATFTRTEVGTPGEAGHGFTWVINVPSELIPPYAEYVSLDAMEYIDGEGDKCIITNIINGDPNYSGANKVDRLGDEDGITIGEEVDDPLDVFKDWLGYRHQLMEIMAPLADTPLDGHREGAALGLDNKVYFHMINTNKNSINPWATQLSGWSFGGISEVVLEGPNGLKVTIPGWNLFNGNQPYPDTKPGLVKYDLSISVVQNPQVPCVSVAFYASGDREELEMGIDLDMLAQAIGYENGDVFTKSTVRFYSATMRELVVERDPPEN